MPETYDAIVIGLGAMGSASLYHLAQRGQKVLGIDMFEEGHDQGSSHGEHRMIRMSAGSSSLKSTDGYVPLVARAFELWDELEHEAGRNLIKILGEIAIQSEDRLAEMGITLDHLQNNPFRQLLTEEDLRSRFPGVRVQNGIRVTYEAQAGYLRPEACISAHLAVARQHGAEIRRPETVTGWNVDGEGVAVTTDTGRYLADRLVIAGGAYAEELLGDLDLPLQVTRIVNGYFEPRSEHWYAENGAPDFLLSVPEGGFYGMPADEGVGLKIGLHYGTETTARTIDRQVHDEEIEFLRGVLDRYMPGASGPVVKKITCMYTMTPDEDFIVEPHPEHPQVAIACGFSGRGFKFSPTVGEIMADFVTRGKTDHDIDFLSSTRFQTAGVAD
ncbi:N-methyl-L-tryptophan oxidase [soil metagenome]